MYKWARQSIKDQTQYQSFLNWLVKRQKPVKSFRFHTISMKHLRISAVIAVSALRLEVDYWYRYGEASWNTTGTTGPHSVDILGHKTIKDRYINTKTLLMRVVAAEKVSSPIPTFLLIKYGIIFPYSSNPSPTFSTNAKFCIPNFVTSCQV